VKTAISIVIAGVVVAASIVFIFRWEVIGYRGDSPVNGSVYRLDRWTGSVAACSATVQEKVAVLRDAAPYYLNCTPWTSPAGDLPSADELFGPDSKPK
jgi:hypothetical protein